MSGGPSAGTPVREGPLDSGAHSYWWPTLRTVADFFPSVKIGVI